MKHEATLLSKITLHEGELVRARAEFKEMQHQFGTEDIDFKGYYPLLYEMLNLILVRETDK